MSELTNNTNPQAMNNGQQVVNPAPQQPIPEQGQVMMQPQMVMVQPAKETLLDKAKRHKAAIAAAIVGIGTTITSAIMAYKKGKEAGAMQQMPPMPDPYGDDNSLNPNI